MVCKNVLLVDGQLLLQRVPLIILWLRGPRGPSRDNAVIHDELSSETCCSGDFPSMVITGSMQVAADTCCQPKAPEAASNRAASPAQGHGECQIRSFVIKGRFLPLSAS